nr:hypothetical protein Itr_chr14CG09360 [Ipomoea trifida]
MVFCESASEGDISAISKGVDVQQAGGAGIITVNPPSEGQFLMAQPLLISGVTCYRKRRRRNPGCFGLAGGNLSFVYPYASSVYFS